MSAYQDAINAINVIGSGRAEDARQELAALKALVDLALEKLPADTPDYTTEEVTDANIPK